MSDDLRSALDGLYMQYRGKVGDIHAENRTSDESAKMLRVYEDVVSALAQLIILERQQREEWNDVLHRLRSRARVVFD